jgi:hypothetical protein
LKGSYAFLKLKLDQGNTGRLLNEKPARLAVAGKVLLTPEKGKTSSANPIDAHVLVTLQRFSFHGFTGLRRDSPVQRSTFTMMTR